MGIEALRGVLRRYGAGRVLEDFEDAATGDHREGFLDRASFKPSRRTDLSDAVAVKM